jgi:hypothetical protein
MFTKVVELPMLSATRSELLSKKNQRPAQPLGCAKNTAPRGGRSTAVPHSDTSASGPESACKSFGANHLEMNGTTTWAGVKKGK